MRLSLKAEVSISFSGVNVSAFTTLGWEGKGEGRGEGKGEGESEGKGQGEISG